MCKETNNTKTIDESGKRFHFAYWVYLIPAFIIIYLLSFGPFMGYGLHKWGLGGNSMPKWYIAVSYIYAPLGFVCEVTRTDTILINYGEWCARKIK